MSVAAPAAENPGKKLAGGLFKAFRKSSGQEAQAEVQSVCPSGIRNLATGVCDAVKPVPRTALQMATAWRGGFKGEETFDLFTVKLLLTACLATLNVACWYLPLKVKRFTESKLAISVANAFSGGVFLSLAFGHMLPHACHGFEGSGLSEALPYYLTLTGYLLIFFVEKIAFDAHELLHDDADGHHHHHGEAAATAAAADAVLRGKDQRRHSSSANAAAGGVVAAGGAAVNKGAGSGRSATILLLALSVHSLFETMALGLSSSKLNVCLLAMSIGLHQPAESLALLVSFLKTGMPEKSIIKMLSLFSCVGPLGVAAGVLVAQYAGKLADAVLVAMAAGTFVYVGATEVVADEFETPHHKWKKFGALLGGVVLIGYITSWAEALEHRAS